MKTIFQKEWRENFKVAVIGFAIFTFWLVVLYQSCTRYYHSLQEGETSWEREMAQPLLSGLTLFVVAMMCAFFGAIIGWLQIHNERHRDLRAFLMHRPISPTKIFLGKVMAGLCLYALGAGLPLLGFILMVRMPGHVPAPFEWAMTLPIIAFYLSGIVFYFGGLLTGIRQARWYASRGLGLGVGIVVLMTQRPEFWQVLIVILVGALIAGIAAWGSFVNDGYYEGRSKWSRPMLVMSVMLGCFVVVGLITSLATDLFERDEEYSVYASEVDSHYEMTRDGTLYKVTQHANKTPIITDLNGETLIDKKTGQPMTKKEFDKKLPLTIFLAPYFTEPKPGKKGNGGFTQMERYFSLLHETPDTLWYWTRNGRVSGYDLASRKLIGSLGPEGFAPGASTGPGSFSRKENYSSFYDPNFVARTLITDTALYELDYDHRTSRPFFTTTNNERIGDAKDVALSPESWDYTLVVTRDFVRVLTPDGKCVAQTAYEPSFPAYNRIDIKFLESTNQFAVWFYPNWQTNWMSKSPLPTRVAWLTTDQGTVKSADLPNGERDLQPRINIRLVNVVGPAAFFLCRPLIFGRNNFYAFWLRQNLELSLAIGLIYVVAGFWLGRRHHFSAALQLKWAIFHLLFGLPGFLAFLCVQEWPAREVCPNCKKLRLVDREKCEYCEAEFAPPVKNGTEIFEVAGS